MACIDEQAEPAFRTGTRPDGTELDVAGARAGLRARADVTDGHALQVRAVIYQDRISHPLGPHGPDLPAQVQPGIDGACGLQFNPRMFFGTDPRQLVLCETGKQLDKNEAKLKDIAGKLATYGQLLLPLAAVVGAGHRRLA
jgi:hypothetical protein